jgi:hypothetical protein
LFRALAAEHQVQVIAPIAWTVEYSARVRGKTPVGFASNRTRMCDGMIVHHPCYAFTPKVMRGWHGRFFLQSVRGCFGEVFCDFRPDVVLGCWAYPDGWAGVRLAREAGLDLGLPRREQVDQHFFSADTERFRRLHGDRGARSTQIDRAIQEVYSSVVVHADCATGGKADIEPEARGNPAATVRAGEWRGVVLMLQSRMHGLQVADTRERRTIDTPVPLLGAVNPADVERIQAALGEIAGDLLKEGLTVIGLVLLLVACELLGLGSAQWFFRVFQVTVPAAVITSFNRLSAQGMFLLNGAVLGLVLFLWCLGVLAVAPFFRARVAPAGAEPTR